MIAQVITWIMNIDEIEFPTREKENVTKVHYNYFADGLRALKKLWESVEELLFIKLQKSETIVDTEETQ